MTSCFFTRGPFTRYSMEYPSLSDKNRSDGLRQKNPNSPKCSSVKYRLEKMMLTSCRTWLFKHKTNRLSILISLGSWSFINLRFAWISHKIKINDGKMFPCCVLSFNLMKSKMLCQGAVCFMFWHNNLTSFTDQLKSQMSAVAHSFFTDDN